MLRTLLILLLLAAGSAWSGNPETIKTNGSHQTTQKEEAGTEKFPFFIRGEITTKKDGNESEEDAQERIEKSSIDRALVKYTRLLAIFTFLLFVFTAALWWVTFQLSKDGRKTSERQAIETQRSLELADKQISLTQKQLQLEQWQYITTHRPKLIIRRISLDGGDGDFFTAGNSSPKIQFIVANVGGSKATIIESNATFAKIDGELPPIPPYDVRIDAIKCTVKEAGQSDPPEFIYINDPEISPIVRSWNGKTTITNGESSPFYFFGYIQYGDEVGVVRRMTFCRRYNPSTKRFMRVDDPEYEYGD